MDAVTLTNMFEKVFTNLKEVLDTNTNGYKVSPTYSKNSSLPIITLETSFRNGNPTFEKNKVIWTVDINSVAGTVLTVQTLAQEIQDLIQTNEDEFSRYNMTLMAHPIMNSNTLQRGKGRVHVRTLTFQLLVSE